MTGKITTKKAFCAIFQVKCYYFMINNKYIYCLVYIILLYFGSFFTSFVALVLKVETAQSFQVQFWQPQAPFCPHMRSRTGSVPGHTYGRPCPAPDAETQARAWLTLARCAAEAKDQQFAYQRCVEAVHGHPPRQLSEGSGPSPHPRDLGMSHAEYSTDANNDERTRGF